MPNAPTKRKPKIKLWERRSILLPIPIWKELERRHGPSNDRRSACWYGGRKAITEAIINHLLLPKDLETFAFLCTLESMWLSPRYAAMEKTFDATSDQEQAAAASLADPATLPQPGRLTRLEGNSPISVLAGMLRSMGEPESSTLARHFIALAQQSQDAYGMRWVPKEEATLASDDDFKATTAMLTRSLQSLASHLPHTRVISLIESLIQYVEQRKEANAAVEQATATPPPTFRMAEYSTSA